MKYTRIILVFAVLTLALTTNAEEGVAADAGQDIKCYECKMPDNLECLNVNSFKTRSSFVKSCKKGCAVRLGEYGDIGEYDKSVTLARGCDDLEHCEKSGVHCCKCDFDGCNINNYCSTANNLHTKVVATIVFCIALQSWNGILL